MRSTIDSNGGSTEKKTSGSRINLVRTHTADDDGSSKDKGSDSTIKSSSHHARSSITATDNGSNVKKSTKSDITRTTNYDSSSSKKGKSSSHTDGRSESSSSSDLQSAIRNKVDSIIKIKNTISRIGDNRPFLLPFH